MENKKKMVVTRVMNFPNGIPCEQLLKNKMKAKFPKCDYVWEAYKLNAEIGTKWDVPMNIVGTFDTKLPNKVTWKVIHY